MYLCHKNINILIHTRINNLFILLHCKFLKNCIRRYTRLNFYNIYIYIGKMVKDFRKIQIFQIVVRFPLTDFPQIH